MLRLRFSRLNRFYFGFGKGDPAGMGSDHFISLQRTKMRKLMKDHSGHYIETRKQEAKMWSSKLYKSVDGNALSHTSLVPSQNRGISDGTALLMGNYFIQCLKAWINALPSRSRTSRGRDKFEQTCRAGCGLPETPNHVVQIFHRTRGSRVKLTTTSWRTLSSLWDNVGSRPPWSRDMLSA